MARRPLFERNVFTRSRETPGPPNGRPAADVALLNRGPVNEVLRADRVAFDPCDRATLLRVADAPASAVRAPALAPPVLIRSSSMVALGAGEGGLRVRIEWFEPAGLGASAPPSRAPHPRTVVCFFDPEGRRIHRASLVATGEVGEVRLPRSRLGAAGRYVAQACVASDAAEPGEAATCAPAILELPFDVTAGDLATGAPDAG